MEALIKGRATHEFLQYQKRQAEALEGILEEMKRKRGA